jgi:hypothetical protein
LTDEIPFDLNIIIEKKLSNKKSKKEIFIFDGFRKMGFDLNRFEGDVDEELICPICSQVLEEPVQVSK